MSVLSDRELLEAIRAGRLVVDPLAPDAVQPASIDLNLGEVLFVWPRWIRRDPRIDQSRHWKPVSLQLAWSPATSEEHDPLEGPAWVLEPGHRYLATTREQITIPWDCAGQLSARSSWGRDGLAVICGPAGWCDPAYAGRPTLELSVVGSELVIWPGAGCLQLIVHEATSPAERGYQGRYQGDTEPTASRLHRDPRTRESEGVSSEGTK